MRALSPTAALRSNNAESFGEASMLSKAADEKAKAFQGKVKERQNTKKNVTITAESDSPSLTSGDFIRQANQKGKDGNRFASPSHILNPSAERSEQEEVKKEKV